MKLKMYLSTGIQIVEYPFIIKPGMLWSPTNFVGRSLLIAFWIARALTVGKQKETETGLSSGQIWQVCVEVLSKSSSNSAISSGSSIWVPSKHNWIKVELFFRNVDTYLQNIVGCVFKSPSLDFNHASLLDLLAVLTNLWYSAQKLIMKIALFKYFKEIILLCIYYLNYLNFFKSQHYHFLNGGFPSFK